MQSDLWVFPPEWTKACKFWIVFLGNVSSSIIYTSEWYRYSLQIFVACLFIFFRCTTLFIFFTNFILLRSEVRDRILLLCWIHSTSVILTIKRLPINSSKFLSQPGHKSFHILFCFNSTTWNFSFLQPPLPPLYLVWFPVFAYDKLGNPKHVYLLTFVFTLLLSNIQTF